MKLHLKIALFILIQLMGKLCYSQYLVSSTFVNTMSQISLNSLTGLALQYDVDMYKMQNAYIYIYIHISKHMYMYIYIYIYI